MTSLKRLNKWWIGSAVILLLLFLSLFPFNLGRYDGILGKVADAGHFWFYLLAGFFFYQTPRIGPVTIPLLCVASGLIELVQPYVQRDGNLEDFFVSSLGALGGYLLHSRVSSLTKFLFVSSLSVLLSAPIYWRAEALEEQSSRAPQLSIFDSSYWNQLWVPNQPDGRPSAELEVGLGGRLDVIPTLKQAWAGVLYLNFELPWNGYRRLEIEVESPIDQMLYLRIDDNEACEKFTDRFNHGYQLQKGANTISVTLEEIQRGPENRKLNLEKIRKVYLFSETDKSKIRPDHPVFSIRSMRLGT